MAEKITKTMVMVQLTEAFESELKDIYGDDKTQLGIHKEKIYSSYKKAFNNSEILEWLEVVSFIQKIYDGNQNIFYYKPVEYNRKKYYISRPKDKLFNIYSETARMFKVKKIESSIVMKVVEKIKNYEKLSLRSIESLVSTLMSIADWVAYLKPLKYDLIAKATENLISYDTYKLWTQETQINLEEVLRMAQTNWAKRPYEYIQAKKTKAWSEEELILIGEHGITIDWKLRELASFIREMELELSEAIEFYKNFGSDKVLYEMIRDIPISYDELTALMTYNRFSNDYDYSKKYMEAFKDIILEEEKFKKPKIDTRLDFAKETLPLMLDWIDKWNELLEEAEVSEQEIQNFWKFFSRTWHRHDYRDTGYDDPYRSYFRVPLNLILPHVNTVLSLTNLYKFAIDFERFHSREIRNSKKYVADFNETIILIDQLVPYDINDGTTFRSYIRLIKNSIKLGLSLEDTQKLTQMHTANRISDIVNIQDELGVHWDIYLDLPKLVIEKNITYTEGYRYGDEFIYEVLKVLDKEQIKHALAFRLITHEIGNINPIVEEIALIKRVIHISDRYEANLLESEEVDELVEYIQSVFTQWFEEARLTPNIAKELYHTLRGDLTEAKKWSDECIFSFYTINKAKAQGFTPKETRDLLKYTSELDFPKKYDLTYEEAKKVLLLIDDINTYYISDKTFDYLEEKGLDEEIIYKIAEAIGKQYPKKEL